MRQLVLWIVPSCLIGVSGYAQSPGTFTPTGSMTTPRVNHTATVLFSGKVLIAGGDQSNLPGGPPASAELYDPANGTFTATGNMIEPREGHSATLLPDGRVLIAGGASDLSAEVYDPSTGTFAATGNMVAKPFSCFSASCATALQNGRVFVPGSPTAQIYDPISGTFAATAPYAAPAPVGVQAAVLCADGSVLIVGFSGNPGGPPSGPWNELYSPASDTFILPANNIDNWLDVYMATLLANGNVLFLGNVENDGLPADVELYEPAAEAFTQVGSALANHEYGNLTLLPDGTVLITGGQLPGGNGSVQCELYTTGGTFSPVGNMVNGRHQHTATLLADGTVLITGGYTFWPSPTSTAELYHPAAVVPAPDLFTVAGYTADQGAIWHAETGQLASPDNPAAAGDVLAMYTDRLTEGSLIPPQVDVGGRAAQILFFGDAPDYPGYFQVNFQVPSGVAGGSSVPIRVVYLGRSSNTMTIALQ